MVNIQIKFINITSKATTVLISVIGQSHGLYLLLPSSTACFTFPSPSTRTSASWDFLPGRVNQNFIPEWYESSIILLFWVAEVFQ